MKKGNYNKKTGFGILEIVIGVSIISISLFGLIAVSQFSLRAINESSKNIKAAFLLEEGIEAIRILRDSSWQTDIAPLTSGTTYYLDFDGTTWNSTTINIYIDDLFERNFVINDIYRDANDDISETGTLDSNTKKVTVSVSWLRSTGTTTKIVSTYIANLFNN